MKINPLLYSLVLITIAFFIASLIKGEFNWELLFQWLIGGTVATLLVMFRQKRNEQE